MKITTAAIEAEEIYVSRFINTAIQSNESFAELSDEGITEQLNQSKAFDLAHANYVLNLIFTYISHNHKEEAPNLLQEGFICPNINELTFYTDIDVADIPNECEKSHIRFLNSKYFYKNGTVKSKGSKTNFIDKGAVYTQSEIAHKIVKGACCNLSADCPTATTFKVLDFACGTGRFYKEVIIHLSEKLSKAPSEIVLNHAYGIDIDPIAVNVTRLKALSFILNYTAADLNTIADHIINKNGLIQGVLNVEDFNAITPEDFNGLHLGGFDIIVSNPPYLVLKPNKKLSSEAWAALQQQIAFFRSSGQYIYSIEGMLNLYQLSIEAMLRMLKPEGNIGVICPSTLFADISASKLRKHLLDYHTLTSIEFYSEDITLFENVTQATCIFHLRKGNRTQTIEVKEGNKQFTVDMDLVKHLFNEHYEIPNISKVEWSILKKLSSQKRLKQYTEIRNKRGELDLTLFSSYISSVPTQYRLIRGRAITENGISDNISEYVLPEFIDKKSEDYRKYDFSKKRLICQQISNATCSRRLRFIYCEANDILGNSCNYISADFNILQKLDILLNSALLNWRFKVTSSNNHINNYELDALPIINLELIDENKTFETPREMDAYVCELYGLNKTETNFILKNENI